MQDKKPVYEKIIKNTLWRKAITYKTSKKAKTKICKTENYKIKKPTFKKFLSFSICLCDFFFFSYQLFFSTFYNNFQDIIVFFWAFLSSKKCV